MSETVKAAILKEDQVIIAVDKPQTDYVKVRSHVIPGCSPTEGNYVIAYWKNTNTFNLDVPPTDVFSVSTDSGINTLNLSLGMGSYVFAYSTRPYVEADYKQSNSGFCAVGYVDPYDKNQETVNKIHLELVECDWETVIVKATLPETCKPSSSGNWVGIWEGEFTLSAAPAGFAKAQHDKSSATTIVNIALKRDQRYTIAYGMGGFQEKEISAEARMTVAATLTFKI